MHHNPENFKNGRNGVIRLALERRSTEANGPNNERPLKQDA
ncbi:MAG: hypothetical protein ACX93T_03415 [Bacteroidota bacterium]